MTINFGVYMSHNEPGKWEVWPEGPDRYKIGSIPVSVHSSSEEAHEAVKTQRLMNENAALREGLAKIAGDGKNCTDYCRRQAQRTLERLDYSAYKARD